MFKTLNIKVLLSVFIDLKVIKCSLQNSIKKAVSALPLLQVHEMCLKSHVARLEPSSMMFVNGKLHSGPLYDLVDQCCHSDEVET